MPQNVLQTLKTSFPAAAAALTAVVGIAAIVFALYKKWKATQPAAGGAAPAPVATTLTQPRLSKNSLGKIYDDFIEDLPSAYRRSTTNFQPIIVLGPDGSGQSELISRFAAWERESKAFIPSSVGESDLRIYMGSHVMVHELSPAVFSDTSKDARVALERLCRPLFKVRRPIVVFTIDANDVLEGNPSDLVGLADLLRGKVHLLSQLHKREGVEIRVALMHMDKIPGFLAFAAFAKAARYPTILRFARGEVSESALRDQVTAIGDALPLALIRCDAPTYLQVLELTRVIPTLADRLATFLKHVASPVGTSNPPYLSEVHFAGPEGSAGDPFHVSDADLVLPDRSPLRRHAATAGALALALSAYFLTGLSIELSMFSTADAALDQARQSTTPIDLERSEAMLKERAWRRDVMAVFNRHDGWLRYLPGFVRGTPFGADEATPAMGLALSNVIESRIIVAQLRRLRDPVHQHRRGPRALYLVAILRGNALSPSARRHRANAQVDAAQPDKGMGRLIEGELVSWSTATGLPGDLITDYLTLSPSLYDIGKLRRALPPESTDVPALQWDRLLDQVASVISRRMARPEELQPIREGAAICLPYVRALAEFPELESIVEVLRRQTGAADLVTLVGYDHHEQIEMARWATSSGGSATTMLELLAASNLGPRDPTVSRALNGDEAPENLPSLTTALWSAKHNTPGNEASRGQPGQSMRVHSQSFSRQAWLDILLRSRVKVEIEAFLNSHVPGEDVFFASDSIPLSSIDDSPFFSMPDPVSARYTHAAFERNVHASVVELDAILRALEFPTNDPVLDTLNKFVDGSMHAYAQRYAAANMQHIDAFGVHGLDTVEALRVVLGQMSSDGSPLDHVLSTIVTNTRIEVPENEHDRFAPLTTSLGRFLPLHALIGPDGMPTPALQSYKQIIAGAMAALDGGPPPAPAAGGAAAPADFSAVGVLALGQIHRDPASFATLVNQWANGLGLSRSFRRPFLEPLRGLERVGVDEVHYQTEDEWREEIEPPLDALLELYPFDEQATREATPAQITAVLHPTDGSLARFVAAYVDPVSLRRRDGTYRPRPTRDGSSLSRSVYRRINAAIIASRLFFAEDGTPIPLRVTVMPQLLETVRDHGPSVTLGFLRAGETTVFAFNQRSTEVDLSIDWTQRTAAQVGVQLEDPQSGGNLTPRPLEARGYFALLRLLDRAERLGDRCSWSIGRAHSRVEFTVANDPVPAIRRIGVR